jgi:hypothetical protein
MRAEGATIAPDRTTVWPDRTKVGGEGVRFGADPAQMGGERDDFVPERALVGPNERRSPGR